MHVKAGLFVLALWGCATASAQHAQFSPPDWLSGYWLSCEGGVETAETWIGAGRGVLLGANLTRGSEVAYEFLRIAPNEQGGVSYFSKPNGRAPPTAFALVTHEGQRAVFENSAHDFPQRILYWRDGDTLHARIEDMAGANQMSWRFTRAAPDARCPG